MKKILKTLAMLAVVIGAGFYWLAAMPARVVPDGPESQARFQPGPYRVVTEKIHWIDSKRPTAPNRDYHGSAQREFSGHIWRGAAVGRPMPLLVYSHGFMSFDDEGVYLARFLASRGYTVVSVNYPLTHFFAPGQPQLADVVNQPADVSFVIDTILSRAADTRDPLFHTIDPERIAVAGLSLGGLTSELVAFHRDVRDPRIKAAVSIAGPAAMMTEKFFQTAPHLPFMMIGGDVDAMVPYATNAQPIPQKMPGSVLVTLHGGSHAGFSAMSSTFLRFYSNPDSLGCEKLKQGLHDVKNDFLEGLTGEAVGIVVQDRRLPCSDPLPPVAMQAARQQMFTTLAISSFLDSIFNEDAPVREQASRYLRHVLAAENAREVAVSE